MKKTLILISLICSSTLLQENDILGYWLNKEGMPKFKYGKIVWLEKPKDENGQWRLSLKIQMNL